MENALKGNQDAVPRGSGRPPPRVDQAIDQLTQIVVTLVNTFPKLVTNNRGNQPQPSNLVDPMGGNDANGHQETHTEGTGETTGRILYLRLYRKQAK
ncbi:hypothetical protein TIFTF001_028479 [Ficus carica]|uniref:Uncharacterized protein n=1 Tax=Ficus carica TaxID=3494 RepID=A0AA88DPZ6_FICCA|nr:hypothetical protein TIFTF001_028479 [Ficus carica]